MDDRQQLVRVVSDNTDRIRNVENKVGDVRSDIKVVISNQEHHEKQLERQTDLMEKISDQQAQISSMHIIQENQQEKIDSLEKDVKEGRDLDLRQQSFWDTKNKIIASIVTTLVLLALGSFLGVSLI